MLEIHFSHIYSPNLKGFQRKLSELSYATENGRYSFLDYGGLRPKYVLKEVTENGAVYATGSDLLLYEYLYDKVLAVKLKAFKN